jgi:rubredoxin
MGERTGLLRPQNPPPHDYEPGDTYHPMHTDPLCRICGATKKARHHNA